MTWHIEHHSYQLSPRTYTQIHTPTLVHWGWIDLPPPSRVFALLQYLQTILPSVERL